MTSRSANGTEAFRWTSAGMVGLGDLPGGTFASKALGVSPDGRIVVGIGTVAGGERATVWDAVNGLRDLRSILVGYGLGTSLTGWTLTGATGVTVAPNGMTVISGYGTGPDGNTQAFTASLPLVANFSTLGALPGGNFVSSSRAISADGATIVGVSGSVTGNRAFVWNNERGMYDIGAGAALGSSVSGDGKIVVGQSAMGDAIRWIPSGVNFLGTGSVAKVVSADGSSIAGCVDQPNATLPYLKTTPTLWTSNQTQSFPTFINGNRASAVVTALAKDGSVLVGNALPTTGATTVSRAFLWRTNGTQVAIPAIPGGTLESEAAGVSADGTVVVGWSRGARGPEAFRWTAAGGTVALGNVPGGNASRAMAISPDGSTIVGISAVNGQNRAFIWDAANGMRDLLNFVASRGLAEKVAGWNLYSACGVTVTPSGVVAVTGAGTDPAGRTQSFIVTLPTLIKTPAQP